eukprot:Hpha_TRINITY_DN16291_c2_g2::TRINITY_DN16291_c2_g2_i1::g.14151::m.14151/K07359/CAMKK2; calcium/calmodulin-dependent protein kinase kinase 2
MSIDISSPTFSPQAITSPASHVVDTTAMRKGEDDDGNKTINEYAVITELGRGAYGKVKLVTHIPTDQWFAIKIMNKHVLSRVRKGVSGKTAMDDVLREIAIMKALDHPNVVKLHEVINDPSCKKLYLIIDYVENGPIWNMGDKALEVATIRKHLVGMCQGLDYLHAQNVLHRDIKPDNLLVDGDDQVRWCDFGVSGARDADGDGEDDLILDSEGTPAFLTPEQCKQQPLSGRMVDLWAMGVTLYCMTFGRLPFTGSSIQEMTESICGPGPSFEDCPDPDLRDLLERLLHPDPEKRIGKKDGVKEILRHRFICEEEGAKEVMHRKISLQNVTLADAVKTGNNVQLQMSKKVGVAMKIDALQRKFKNKRRTTVPPKEGGALPQSAVDEKLEVVEAIPKAPLEKTDADAGQEAAQAGVEGDWHTTVRYIEEKGVARLIDNAVRELVSARPKDAALWLAQHFEKNRPKISS